jgi:hypothetical protein
MPDKITKISVSDKTSAPKEEKIEPTSSVEQQPAEKSPATVAEKTATPTTITGEKRIEPLTKQDESSSQPTEPEKPHEQEEHPTPDSSQIMTAHAEENMQNPKLFDTKEYHLPITQSVHGHGSKLGAILFGLIFAVLAALAAIYFLQ